MTANAYGYLTRDMAIRMQALEMALGMHSEDLETSADAVLETAEKFAKFVQEQP